MSVCLFVCPIMNQEPRVRFASNFDWATRETHGNVPSVVLRFYLSFCSCKLFFIKYSKMPFKDYIQDRNPILIFKWLFLKSFRSSLSVIIWEKYCECLVLHTVHCTVYIVLFVHTVHCINCLYCTFYTYCPLYCLYCTFYTFVVHCAVYIVLFIHTVHCAVYIVLFMHTVQCILYMLYFLYILSTLYCLYCTFCTYCPQTTVYIVLFINILSYCDKN